jgi:bacteriorhodopsin
MMFPMSAGQFDLVYNATSFTLASMGASTIFFWLRIGSIHEKYKSAMTITGLVTFIALYHYIRIFNSWVESYEFPASTGGEVKDPVITGQPFNDAYRYMDWLLTVPLLLIEIVFVMKLDDAKTVSLATSLGFASGLMIILGYPGELIIEGDLSVRWMYWTLAMLPFLYVVYTLLIGLKGAIASETDPAVAGKLSAVCWATVISWCTYPIVYVFPMMGISGPNAVVAIQLGYCVADIISKCGVGFLIYNITIAKSNALNGASGNGSKTLM